MLNCNHQIENLNFISTKSLGLSENSFVQMPTVIDMLNYIKVYFSNRDAQGFASAYSVDLSKTLPFKILNVQKLNLDFGKLGQHDETGIMPSSVIKINKQLYMYYVGWARLKNVPYKLSIGLARGNLDGTGFHKFSGGPILSSSVDNPYFVTSPHVRITSDKFQMLYASGSDWQFNENRYESTYYLKKCDSNDGINWTNHQNVFEFNDLNYCTARPVAYKNHLFFSKRPTVGFRQTGNGYRILLINTSDSKNLNPCRVKWLNNVENSLDVSYGFPIEIEGVDYLFYNGAAFGKYGMHIARITSEDMI